MEVIDERQSVRQYQDREIEQDKIDKIVEAATSAPSAGGLAAYRIEVVEQDRSKRRLAKAAGGQRHVADASHVLVFLQDRERSASKYGERGRNLYSLQDATIAAAYSQLAATDLNLASCWVGAFDETEVKETVNSDLRPVALITIGYPRS